MSRIGGEELSVAVISVNIRGSPGQIQMHRHYYYYYYSSPARRHTLKCLLSFEMSAQLRNGLNLPLGLSHYFYCLFSVHSTATPPFFRACPIIKAPITRKFGAAGARLRVKGKHLGVVIKVKNSTEKYLPGSMEGKRPTRWCMVLEASPMCLFPPKNHIPQK